MKRRDGLKLAALAGAWPLGLWSASVRAHHGWGSFDTNRPIFLAGTVARANWANPHVELVLDVDTDLRVPPDLATRAVPSQRAAIDAQAVLAAAVVPRRKDRQWHVELAPLFRMNAWEVQPVKPGERVMVVGYTYPEERGDAVLRAEYLFVGDAAYALRSNPA